MTQNFCGRSVIISTFWCLRFGQAAPGLGFWGLECTHWMVPTSDTGTDTICLSHSFGILRHIGIVRAERTVWDRGRQQAGIVAAIAEVERSQTQARRGSIRGDEGGRNVCTQTR